MPKNNSEKLLGERNKKEHEGVIEVQEADIEEEIDLGKKIPDEEVLSDLDQSAKYVVGQRVDKKSPKKGLFSRAKNIIGGLGLLAAIGSGATMSYEKTSATDGVEFTNSSQDKRDATWKKAKSFDKYALSAREALPSVADKSDIDPRYAQEKLLNELAAGTDGAEKVDLEFEAAQFHSELEAGGGWANKKLQDQFNLLLGNRDIRDRLINSNITVADAFSLLKSVIKSSEKGTYLEKLEKRMNQQEALKKTELVGPKTEKVIVFNYAAESSDQNFFNGEGITEMTKKALGTKAEKNPGKYIEIINATKVEDLKKTTAGEQLLSSIAESSGETFLYLNTHASGNEIAVDLSNKKNLQTISVDGLASSFLNRLAGEATRLSPQQAKNTLGKMKVVIDGCKGYNLAQNLASSIEQQYHTSGLEQQWGIPFEELGLPTIVTMGGEDSSVLAVDKSLGEEYASGSRALGQKKYIDRVAQDHALTGKTLFELGAKSYITGGDMTWFVPEKGKLIEISKTEQTSSRDQMA